MSNISRTFQKKLNINKTTPAILLNNRQVLSFWTWG